MTTTTQCRDKEQFETDMAFISVFGEPMRDKEMLSWEDLYFDSKFKCIRCNTCGCPAEICTCSIPLGDKGN